MVVPRIADHIRQHHLLHRAEHVWRVRAGGMGEQGVHHGGVSHPQPDIRPLRVLRIEQRAQMTDDLIGAGLAENQVAPFFSNLLEIRLQARRLQAVERNQAGRNGIAGRQRCVGIQQLEIRRVEPLVQPDA